MRARGRRKAEIRRREKDAADRNSFAGMVLAHSDASVQLRSQLQAADRKLHESEVIESLNRTRGWHGLAGLKLAPNESSIVY